MLIDSPDSSSNSSSVLSCKTSGVQHATLEHNSIYASLFIDDPGNSWHWAIYLHQAAKSKPSDAASGYKLHVTETNGTWKYECIAVDLPSDVTLTVLAKIGEIQDASWGVEFLQEYLSPIPMEIPEVDQRRERAFTSRVWFREAIRVVHGEQLFVDCPDVDSLERELSSQARLVDAMTQRYSNEPISVYLVSKYACPVSLDDD